VGVLETFGASHRGGFSWRFAACPTSSVVQFYIPRHGIDTPVLVGVRTINSTQPDVVVEPAKPRKRKSGLSGGLPHLPRTNRLQSHRPDSR
jgi:hypothetical protein